MRSIVLVALLFSSVALGGTDVTVAQKKKQELAEAAREAAQKLEEHSSYVVLLQPMPPQKMLVSEIEPFVLMGEGWSAITENGVWSTGKRSSLYILLEGERPRQLQLQGMYFNGNEPTRLFVNGQLLSETSLEDHTVDLPPGLEESSSLHIQLQHLNPVSPQDLKPDSPDTRKIKYKLEQIRVW